MISDITFTPVSRICFITGFNAFWRLSSNEYIFALG
ncbi:hypothetical protein MAUB1S_11179 [Mycolicibacterium aubagnense]